MSPSNRTNDKDRGYIIPIGGAEEKFHNPEILDRFLEVCGCLLYTSPSPRDQRGSRMPSSA